jgi:hypothetical protein
VLLIRGENVVVLGEVVSDALSRSPSALRSWVTTFFDQ